MDHDQTEDAVSSVQNANGAAAPAPQAEVYQAARQVRLPRPGPEG